MLSQIKISPIAVLVSAALLSGCNESSDSSYGEGYDANKEVETDFNEKTLVINITDNIISPVFTAFKDVTNTQHQQVVTYCDAVKSKELSSTLTDAQNSWEDTMLVWQQAEMMQVKPLLDSDSKLRNDIYSWPNVFTCGVDQDTIFYMNGEFNGQTYAIEERRANRKGLYALEYLLFNQSSEHSCQVSAPEGWDELTLQQLEVARCEYASEVARDLTDNANKLEADWLAFSNELTSAGESGSEFDTVHDAVNHLSDAMFYLDSLTKDAKLATPLGLVANSCGAQACPADVESPYANHSVENIVENLNGFEQFFSGGTGIGFVDYLTYVGDEDTAEQMTLAISAAKEQLALYEASLAQTLVDDEAQVEQTHKNVKAITDKLKTDFIHSLALELPSTSAGDND